MVFVNIPHSKIENKLRKNGYKLIAGVDEAGRGSLAGPVVAAAVILSSCFRVQGIKDSKCLSASRRQMLFEKIKKRAFSVGVGIVDQKTIDKINILQATFLAMQKAIANLTTAPDAIIVDGPFEIPGLSIFQKPLIGADKKCKSVSCASIVAKVIRDNIMIKADNKFKGFYFAKHKGYGTKFHFQRIKDYGPSDYHRLSFL